MKKLHREGCDLDSIDYLGRGVLHVVAVTEGLDEIARYLCQQNIRLDLLDNKARSPLYLAIEAENFSVAHILAASGASVICDGERLAKILCSIGFEGNLFKLRFLVSVDAEIE